MKKDLFISYSSVDRSFVTRLAKEMIRKGITLWIDEGEILPGDRIREKINQGIAESRYFVVVLSKNSISSSWVQTELDAAMIKEIEGNDVVVIPVLVGDINNKDIPPDLKGKAYVDFRRKIDFSSSANRLSTSIRRRIDELYQYEIIYATNEVDFLENDGSRVRYLKRKRLRVLDVSLDSLVEEYYSDGTVNVEQVNPGQVINQRRTLNNLIITVDFGRALKRGEEFEQSIQVVYHNSFMNSQEYWLTNQAYPIKGSEYVFTFPAGRPYISFHCAIKRGVQEVPHSTRTIEEEINGRKHLSLYFDHLNAHENVKISWEW